MGSHRILVGCMAVPVEEEGLRNGSVGFLSAPRAPQDSKRGRGDGMKCLVETTTRRESEAQHTHKSVASGSSPGVDINTRIYAL
jgi:hypothetical protein